MTLLFVEKQATVVFYMCSLSVLATTQSNAISVMTAIAGVIILFT